MVSSLSNSQIQDTGTDAGIGTGVGLVSGIKSREVSKQLVSWCYDEADTVEGQIRADPGPGEPTINSQSAAAASRSASF